MEQYDEALEAYRRASDAAPDEASYIFGQGGHPDRAQHDHEQALALLERSLKLDNRNARTWAKMGQVSAPARPQCRRAARLHPRRRTRPALRVGVERARVDALRLRALRRGARLLPPGDGDRPDDMWYWYNQGDALVALGHFRAATEVLERAVKLNRNHAESWAKLGQAYRRTRPL